MKKFLHINALAKKYNAHTPSEVEVLASFNFEADRGELVTIVGANGAGKTTLFDIIAGTTEASAGTVMLDNETLTSIPEFKRSRFISRVSQNPLYSTCPNLTVAENITLGALKTKPIGFAKAITHEQKNKCLLHLTSLNLGLEKKIDEKMTALSGGQKQAVAMLVATVCKPKLLLLDEHTASLDSKAKKSILDLTTLLTKNNGLTTLMITHSISDAIAYGDRLIVIQGGRIVFEASGSQKKVLNQSTIVQMLAA